MRVALGADHRGYQTKDRIAKYLLARGHKIIDFGTRSDESVDYTDIAIAVAEAVHKRKADYGILLCFSGEGMVMTANKVRGIRAALCVNQQYAKYARAHNNANVLVMPAGFMKFGIRMKSVIDTFLNTAFEGGRHLRRIKKIGKYENSTHRV